MLSFHDLLVLRCVAGFEKQGVSLAAIHATVESADEQFGDYPLQSKRFLTDGKRIVLEAVESAADDPRSVDLRRRQFVFDAVIPAVIVRGYRV